MEAVIQQMQNELATTRGQMAAMAHEHDTLKAAHEALRQATDAAWHARTAEINNLEMKLKQLLFKE